MRGRGKSSGTSPTWRPRLIRGGLKVAAALAGLVVTALVNGDTTAGENILDLMEVDPGYEVEFNLFRSGGDV